MPVCTAQYAELGLFFTMPFVGIRIILVLRLSFAVSKPDETLSLSTGDQNRLPIPAAMISNVVFFMSSPSLLLSGKP